MRYIDPERVRRTLPAGWDQRAQDAADAVASAHAANRSTEINRRSQIWQELKPALKEASYGKCWYCESVDVRSDNTVDHFRPKKSVAESPGHDGYWWLAFKWENYRFCCTYCNCRRVDQVTSRDGGKADHFPLRDETKRASAPTDSLDDEEPLLLDPTHEADTGFLWFDETGQAVPGPVCGTNPSGHARERVMTSIKFYHLNHTNVVEHRKTLCAKIRRRVEEADRYFVKYDAGDGTAREAFEDAVRDLRNRLTAKAPYSATARAMLMGLRGKHPIVDVILSAA